MSNAPSRESRLIDPTSPDWLDGYRTAVAEYGDDAALSMVIMERDAWFKRVEELEAAIDDYSLWAPGRAGHAAAHRTLMEVRHG